MLRPLGWSLAAFALALLLAVLALRSPALQRRLTEVLVERLETALQREVTVEEARFELLPPGVTVRGLTVAGAEPGEPAFGSVGRAELELDVLRLWRPAHLALRRVRVESPSLRLEFHGPGENNLPRLRRGERKGPGERAFRIDVGELVVLGGEVILEQHRLPLDFEARGFGGRLYQAGEGRFESRLSAADLTVTLPRARPYAATADLTVAVDERRIELVDARIEGPDLRASALGGMEWRGDRELVLEIEADLRAELFERLGYLEGGVAGPVRFTGGLAWRSEAWGFRGTAVSPRLELLGRTVRDVAAAVSGDPNGVSADIDRGSYGGGSVRGSVRFSRREEASATEIDLNLDRVDLDRLLADQGIPLEGLAAAVSGPFNYAFTLGDSRGGRGWANLRLAPPSGAREGPPPAGLPLSGTAPLLIADGVVSSGALRVRGGAQRLLATGSYDLERRAGSFEYRIDSERVEKLIPLLPIAVDPGAPPLWLPAAGRGRIEGTLSILPAGVSTRVLLDLLDVEAPGARADRLQGRLEVSGGGIRDLRLELLRPEAAVIVTGSIPFAGDPGTAPPPFELAVDVAGWPLAEARPWLPLELPVEGPMSGTLLLEGDPERLAGTVRGGVAPVEVFGLSADALEVDLDFAPERTLFQRLELRSPAGSVVLGGVLDYASERLAATLESEMLDLGREPFSSLLPGGLQGRLRLAGALEGRPERPRLNATLTASDLRLAGRELGEAGTAELEVAWDGSRLDLGGSVLGLVRASGGGRLDASGTELELHLETADLRGLAQLATPRDLGGLEGELAGTLTVSGQAGPEAVWLTRLELGRLDARYEGRSLANLEPISIRLEDGGLQVESLYLGEPASGSELFVAGRIGTEPGSELDLRVEGSLETRWFEILLPGFDLAGGTFDLLATVRGSAALPQVVGQGEFRKTKLVAEGLPHSLDNLRGVVLLYPGEVVFDSLRADLAGGKVQAGGAVQLGKTAEEVEYRFQITGRALNTNFPEGWQVRGDAEVVLSSTEEGRRIRGVVNLDRAYYLEDVKVGLAQLLQGLLQRRRLEVEETDEFLVATQLDLIIRGPGALRVRNNLANVRGDVNLTVRGSLARQAVFGRVELERGGTLVYSGNEYLIERGLLTFANPLRIEPVIDLVATTELREYDVTLNLAGTMDRFNATFASDPPLADLEVLTLLTSGSLTERRSRTGEPAGDSASVAAEGFLYGQAASLIADRANRLFGLDRLRIDPLTSSSGSLSSARVTVGERLSRDLFATYSYDPSRTEQQILELEWNLGRGIVLVFTQNGDSSYAVDARIERSF